MILLDKIAAAYKLLPALDGLLSARAIKAIFGELKSYDYFERHVEGLVRGVYNGYIGGEFIDVMADLISGQVRDAYEQAWKDDGNDTALPDYLEADYQDFVSKQYDFVDGYYKDIVDARVDNTPIAPLLSRAAQWAHQYDVAYKKAAEMINLENGGNLQWKKGATEHGCRTCAELDGLVLSAKEWEQLGLHPRGYPNPLLECQGGGPAGYCDCDLMPTDQRRSPHGFETALNIISMNKV